MRISFVCSGSRACAGAQKFEILAMAVCELSGTEQNLGTACRIAVIVKHQPATWECDAARGSAGFQKPISVLSRTVCVPIEAV